MSSSKESGVNKRKRFKRYSSDHHTLFSIQVDNKIKGTQISFKQEYIFCIPSHHLQINPAKILN